MILFNTFKRSFLKLLLITAGMLIITIPFACLQIYFPQSSHSISHIFSHYSLVFTLFRWSLIVLLFLYWPAFIRRAGKKQYWNPDKTQFWLAQRFRVIGWLIVFELVVCENILLMLLKLFTG